ncbi:MAG TPA: hypothetical protein VF855_13315 [Acidimicrobiales bacterium]
MDFAALGVGDAGDDDLEQALVGLASAAVERDDARLTQARERLVAVAGEAVMVDAAAVAANFEMMTRLADGTGARMWESRVEANVSIIEALHLDTLTSKR